MATPTAPTFPTFTDEMLAAARKIGEALIAVRRAKGKAQAQALADFQTACRESREQFGEDVHNLVKGRALAGATGGRA